MSENKQLELTDLLYEDLVLFDVEASDNYGLLEKIAKAPFEKGFVKDSFTGAIIDREKIFPTGLPTENVKVAIPHTDAVHVNKSCITIAKLKNPVVFKEMGGCENEVDAEIIFMLAMNEPKDQLCVLQKIMNIFSQPEILLQIKNASTSKEIIDILLA